MRQSRISHQETQLPLIEHHSVQEKMIKFHQEIHSLQAVTCSTCMETFPGMKLNSVSECLRCSRDKLNPKLYSAANDMIPGPVPQELQVSTYLMLIYCIR